MLTIQKLQKLDICLSSEEESKYESMPEAVEITENECDIAIQQQGNICAMCGNEPKRIWEYNRLDMCVLCAIQAIKAQHFKDIRGLPFPEHYEEIYSVPTLKQAERAAVKTAIEEGMSKTDTSEILGITRATLYAKLRQHNIKWPS